MKKWSLAGGLLFLGVAVIALISVMWLTGISIEWPNGASRTLANSSPSEAAYVDMAISPDWQTLALGTLQDGAQVWSVKDNKMLYSTEPGRVQTVAISPDGQMLALFWKSKDESSHRIELRQLSDGKLLRTLGDQEEWVYSLTFSADGQSLAVAASGEVQLFGVSDGKELRTIHATAWEVALSPDGKLVAAGGEPVGVWRVADGAPLHTVKGWHYMLFSPDGKVLATVDSVLDSNVNLWDTSTGTLIGTLEAPAPGMEQIHSLAFSPDSETLAAGTNGYSVHVWQVSTGKIQRTIRLGTNNPGEDVVFSPDGRTLAVQTNYKVQFWDLEK
ncbi:MAG TPA: hypothetical protein VFH60_06175 [Chloroflexia bacterium]|nr:hypothetical protein [Chloroflexia bacterium]